MDTKETNVHVQVENKKPPKSEQPKKGGAQIKSHHFSNKQFIVFALVFALIGGYVIFKTFAAAPLVASLQAEQMVLPSGGSVVNDSTASAGKATLLSVNGASTGSVNFPSSVTSLNVIARGIQCSGAPTMKVTLDGTTLLSATSVSSTSWTSYPVTLANPIAAGSHTLSISFTNDFSQTKRHGHTTTTVCSRDLYLDVSNFYGPAPPPPPGPTVSLSATPTTVTAGQSAVLTWNSTNATSCTASGSWSGTQPTTGSTSTGALNQNSTYGLACTGAGGTATTSATVTVTAGGGGGGGGTGGTGGAALSKLYTLEDAAHPTKTTATTCSALASQAANPTASEVDVSPMTCSGQVNFSARPSSSVKYVFAPGVKFTGGPVGGGTLIGVYISGSNLILWGPADVSNPSDDGIRVEGASNIVIGGGIKTHDNGTQGILVQAQSTNIWIDGMESTHNGTHAACVSSGLCSSQPNYDLAGIHGIYWGDGTVGGGVVNTYIHDQPNGYCIEVFQGNNAGSNSVFAFNTLTRCTSPGTSGSDTGGLGVYYYDGGTGQSFVGNVVVGARFAGLGSHSTSGIGQGNVFWNDGQDVYNDAAPTLTVSDSHHLDPQLSASDRPQASSPIKNLSSTYTNYLPRNDFSGTVRTSADPGAFAAP